MANSTAAPPACHRCKSPTTPLVRDGDRQRFECPRCSETFWGPAIAGVPDPVTETARPTAFAPIAIPERTATDGAGPRAKCLKCGKPYFNLGKHYEQHVATCDGKEQFKVKGNRRRHAPLDVQTPAQVYASSVAALLARRAALEAEIRGIDLAVAEINVKMTGAGGPAPAPFPDGSEVMP